MTWLTTWPTRDFSGCPAFAEHETEQAAEAHADELRKSKAALVAVVFWSEGWVAA